MFEPYSTVAVIIAAVQKMKKKERDERDAFLADRRQQLALERALEIVGEAARHVSEGCRMDHPEIPWRQIVALRNVLAHDYGEIDERRVWHVARQEIPGLIAKLSSILPLPPEQEDQ